MQALCDMRQDGRGDIKGYAGEDFEFPAGEMAGKEVAGVYQNIAHRPEVVLQLVAQAGIALNGYYP